MNRGASRCLGIRLRGKSIGSSRGEPPSNWTGPSLPPPRPDDGAGDGREVAGGGQQVVEATLQRIWSASLGVDSIDRNANFFELGGDSVSAIGIATNLAKEGLDISPQDLFEHQSVAALAAALVTRYGDRRAGRTDH